MGFGEDAAASAGPYANTLHLAPDTSPHQHLIKALSDSFKFIGTI